jgi:hypothetical protein
MVSVNGHGTLEQETAIDEADLNRMVGGAAATGVKDLTPGLLHGVDFMPVEVGHPSPLSPSPLPPSAGQAHSGLEGEHIKPLTGPVPL